MISVLRQTLAAISISLLGLPRRIWMSLVAVFAVAVVVAVLLSFLAMVHGFNATLSGTGADDVAVATRVGSRSEINSVLSREQVNLISQAPGVAVSAGGTPIFSNELYVIVDGIKKSSKTEVNLPLRGISVSGLALRNSVVITSGRMFETGKNEIIAGEGVLREFDGFKLGGKVSFAKSEWNVVGTFSTGGSAFESELWADARMVQSQFRRGNSFQSVRLKLAESGNVQAIADYIVADPRLNIDVRTEKEYFADQSSSLNNIVYFGWGISVVMALGALAGALNTMYMSVARRARDIATLRAIGFGGFSVFVGTLTESLLLSVVGGVLGTVAAYLMFDGLSASTLGESFTQVVFKFDFSLDMVINGIMVAVVVGFIGGVFPAWRAAGLPVVSAFRS